MERFAGNTSLSDFTHSLKNILSNISRDPKLREIADDAVFYLERAIGNPEYRRSEASLYRGSVIIRELRRHLYKYYQNDTAVVNEELNHFIAESREDPMTRELLGRLRVISADMFATSPSGKSQIRPPLIRDTMTVLFPMIIEQMSVFHIPRLEYADQKWEVIIDAFDLQMRNFVPEAARVRVN